MSSLFEPTQIGSLNLKNHFIRAAIGGGVVTDAMVQEFTNNIKGGIGGALTGYSLVDEYENYSPLLPIYNDTFKSSHQKLIAPFKENKVPLLIQLVYLGSFYAYGKPPVTTYGPSAVTHLTSKTTPVELTIDQIKSIQQKFVAAAVRAKEFGYDGVEIHGAHGFLLSQFLTPYYNRRTDQYGGSIENRVRIVLEIVDGIRAALGKNYPIWTKINVDDGISESDVEKSGRGGITLEDAIYYVGQLKNHGVDAVEISGNLQYILGKDTSHIVDPFFKNQAIAISNAVDGINIILTGNCHHIDVVNAIHINTKIHHFGLARPLQSNPAFVNKLKEDAKKL